MPDEKPYTLKDWQADVRARQAADPLNGLGPEEADAVKHVAFAATNRAVDGHNRAGASMDTYRRGRELENQMAIAARDLEGSLATFGASPDYKPERYTSDHGRDGGGRGSANRR